MKTNRTHKALTGSIADGLSPHTLYPVPRTPIYTPEEIKRQAVAEANRYMDNAKETLQKARKENNRYEDKKYVRTACGIAWNAVLIALDAYLALNGVTLKKGKRKSIEFYLMHIAKKDRKLLDNLNGAYEILHLWGYYDGLQDARVVARGFELAYLIIKRIQ